jgi:serine/threonine protein kinase
MIGQTISHYKILEKLGSGGMGVVYKAEDTKLKRTVALKFLPPDLTRDDEAKKRFIHEAQAASALDHPNICTIHEIGETEDGTLFICMAYYEGETLKKKVTSNQLSVTSAIDISVQIAQGLTKAHEKGIVHRDIKPANLFVTNDGILKILDFGLAKLAGVTKLTKPGTTLGTVAYMSPEQMQGEEVDQRTDIWALGVVIYEMLTGKLPFKGEYEQAVMYSILNEKPEPITATRLDVPMELERIVIQCLEKEASKRYQLVNELLVEWIASFRLWSHHGNFLYLAKRHALERIWPIIAGLAALCFHSAARLCRTVASDLGFESPVDV